MPPILPPAQLLLRAVQQSFSRAVEGVELEAARLVGGAVAAATPPQATTRDDDDDNDDDDAPSTAAPPPPARRKLFDTEGEEMSSTRRAPSPEMIVQSFISSDALGASGGAFAVAHARLCD